MSCPDYNTPQEQGTPASFLFDKEGKLIGRLPGYLPYEDLKTALASFKK